MSGDNATPNKTVELESESDDRESERRYTAKRQKLLAGSNLVRTEEEFRKTREDHYKASSLLKAPTAGIISAKDTVCDTTQGLRDM